MREIRKSGSMRGRWRRTYGRSQRGTKLETAETARTLPAGYRASALLRRRSSRIPNEFFALGSGLRRDDGGFLSFAIMPPGQP